MPDPLDLIRTHLAHHLDAERDPCKDRGVEWPCDIADALTDPDLPSTDNEQAIEDDLLIYGSAFTINGRRVDPTTVVVRTYQPPNVVAVSPLTSVRQRCTCDPERWRHDDVCPLS